MTTRALVEELIAAWQAHDAHRAAAYFAPSGVYHESGRPPIVGREAILAHFLRFFRDGPAWTIEIDQTAMVAEEDKAAVAYRFSVVGAGGDWRSREGCALVRSEGGLVSLWREYHG